MSRAPAVPRMAAEVAGIAGLGLLHAAAAGALVVGGVALAAPGVLALEGAGQTAAQAVAFGLACLRVPLESGDFRGTFAPLTGLAVTLWGLGSAVRKLGPRWPGSTAVRVAGVAGAFALTCAAAAAVAGAAEAEASVPGAAAAGAAWGALAAGWSLTPRAGSREGGPDRARLAFGRAAPGVTAAVTALALAAAWFVVAIFVRGAGLPAGAFGGGVLLGLAAAPNAAVALVTIALGGRAEVVLDGTALADPTSVSVSLWDWGGSVAPPYVLVLVLVPVAAVLAGGRVAAAVAPDDLPLLRGLRLGAVVGAALVALGWIGSLAAAAGDGEVALRLGFEPLPVFGLALVWGIAGACLGPRLPWRGPRLGR